MPARFDTLDYANQLETAGVPKTQAEIQARALAGALASSSVSPGDLTAVEQNLSARIEAVELRLENKLATIEGEIALLKWMAVTSIGLSTALLLKGFLH